MRDGIMSHRIKGVMVGHVLRCIYAVEAQGDCQQRDQVELPAFPPYRLLNRSLCFAFLAGLCSGKPESRIIHRFPRYSISWKLLRATRALPGAAGWSLRRGTRSRTFAPRLAHQ